MHFQSKLPQVRAQVRPLGSVRRVQNAAGGGAAPWQDHGSAHEHQAASHRQERSRQGTFPPAASKGTDSATKGANSSTQGTDSPAQRGDASSQGAHTSTERGYATSERS